MRGRASGLGARISSMGLVIILAHRSDHAFDECNFVLGDAVLRVNKFVSPSPVPRLLWHPCVSRSKGILSDFSERYEKAEQASPIVAGEALRCPLRLERCHDKIRLSAS